MLGLLPTLAPRRPDLAYPAPQPLVGTAKLYRPGGLTGGNGLTHCQLLPSDAPFTGGAITFYNSQLAPFVIDSCCVAPTAAANDGYRPIDGSGAAVAWTVVPGGPWVIPAGRFYPFGVGGFQMAAGAFAAGAGKIPFTVTSLARSDIAGAPPLLMFRVHIASGQLNAATPTTSQLAAQSAAYGARRPWDGWYKAGNFAAANQAGIGTPTHALVGALSVDFATAVAAKTVLAVGDSTEQGAKSQVSVNGTATLHDYNGAVCQACDALSTPARPVYAANAGFQGFTVDQIASVADYWINAIRPHIVILQPWSVNDNPNSQSLADAAFLKMRAVALKAKRSGMVAAWRTGLPASSLSLANDTVRKTINARCLADPDLPCVDYAAAVGDGGSPERLQSAYDSGDGTHPNNAGYGQIASAKLQPFLQGCLS